ncbi:hypothetical protein AXF42_Ash019143 [Apostasia shenzhenica]|uniref:GYF domain-containing protein n=1 Tax=Apostasia shenzhenica TaxID=1088818 RepID=A0A2I0B2A7_9ASPA|nr:hypothetical protein AXF42_Ash019143 [Apostasia shenzhenica]
MRYSRMKLLDIYRMTDLRDQRISRDGFVEVPSLSQAEPIEPLALLAPTAEEVVQLKAIDKGEIVSSGVPQISKESAIGRKAVDAAVLKQMKTGSQEDVPFVGGDYKCEDNGSIKRYDDMGPNIEPVKQRQGTFMKNADEFSGERSILDTLPPNATPWRSQSVDRSHFLSHDWNDNAIVQRGSKSSMGNQSQLSGDMKNTAADAVFPSFRQDESGWQSNQNGHESRSNSNFRSRPAAKSHQSYPSPEVLSLYYKDPHGQVQGPFSGTDLINWFEAGYFGIDLQVRLASAPAEAPFLLLGDVIPQLRLKVRPPPGFAAAGQSSILDASNKVASTVSSMHSGLGDFSHFSEKLISPVLPAQMENVSEGILHATVGERGNAMNYLPTQKKLLEQQKNSLPNALPFFSGSTPYPASQSMQQLDLISLHNAGQVDKSVSPTGSFGAHAWSNHCDAQVLNAGIGGIEIAQNKMDLHRNPQIGFAGQQQPVGHSGSSEKLISLDVVHSPHMLNLLQQHYLLSNPSVNSQVSLPSQLSLLNECLLLKQQLEQQQHWQELQQQLLLKQQQILLSQVFSGHQLSTNVGEPSYYKFHTDVSDGSVLADRLLLQGQKVQVNQNMPTSNLQDGNGSAMQNVNFQDPESTGNSLSSATSVVHLPHQIFDLGSSSKKYESGFADVGNNVVSDVSLPSVIAKSSLSGELRKCMEALASSNKVNALVPQYCECPASGCSTLSHEVPGASSSVSIVSDQINDLKTFSDDALEQHHVDASAVKDSQKVQASQTKKSAEKKSRKQKNSKSQFNLLTEFSNANQIEQLISKSETEDAFSHSSVLKIHTETINPPQDVLSVRVEGTSISSGIVVDDFQQSDLFPPSGADMDKGVKNINKVAESLLEGATLDAQVMPNHRPWKPAPGVKAKSLKEIQQEEQQRVQMQKTTSDVEIFPSATQRTQLAGIVGCFDQKSGKDTLHDSTIESSFRSDGNLNLKSRKSQLHDLLAEEVLAKLSEEGADLSIENKGQPLQPLPSATSIDVSGIDNDGFVEAKDTKRGRKKGSKAKVAGAKVPSPVGSFDLSTSPISANKVKGQSELQKEKELLPAPPTGPSLADFLPWKGDQTSSSQAPAWSVGLGKLQKPTSLRDIQREQEVKPFTQQNIPIPSPGKVQPNKGSRGSGSSQAPGSSPSGAFSSIHSNSLGPRLLKSKVEDDLFWGPVDQSKQESDQPDFPALGNSNSSSVRASLAKANPVAINRQKPLSTRPAEHVPSSEFTSPGSRAKKDEKSNNLSEAMDFRDWCEKELVRLTGMNDTSLLEYCLKQPTAEAEMMLKENLGSLDRNHEFIDKFLSFKDFLSTAVIETAFQMKSGRSVLTANSEAVAAPNFDGHAEAGKGGKKKGKKGKKVACPAALGFNVVSNRIMMGEIQHIEN